MNKTRKWIIVIVVVCTLFLSSCDSHNDDYYFTSMDIGNASSIYISNAVSSNTTTPSVPELDPGFQSKARAIVFDKYIKKIVDVTNSEEVVCSGGTIKKYGKGIEPLSAYGLNSDFFLLTFADLGKYLVNKHSGEAISLHHVIGYGSHEFSPRDQWDFQFVGENYLYFRCLGMKDKDAGSNGAHDGNYMGILKTDFKKRTTELLTPRDVSIWKFVVGEDGKIGALTIPNKEVYDNAWAPDCTGFMFMDSDGTIRSLDLPMEIGGGGDMFIDGLGRYCVSYLTGDFRFPTSITGYYLRAFTVTSSEITYQDYEFDFLVRNPIVVDDKLFFVDMNDAYVFHSDTGVMEKLDLGSSSITSLIEGDGCLYALGNDNDRCQILEVDPSKYLGSVIFETTAYRFGSIVFSKDEGFALIGKRLSDDMNVVCSLDNAGVLEVIESSEFPLYGLVSIKK